MSKNAAKVPSRASDTRPAENGFPQSAVRSVTLRAGRPFSCVQLKHCNSACRTSLLLRSCSSRILGLSGAAYALDAMTTHIIMAARHVLGLQQHRVKIGVLAARALVCGLTNIRTWATSTSVSTPGHLQGRNLLLHQVSALDACSAAAR